MKKLFALLVVFSLCIGALLVLASCDAPEGPATTPCTEHVDNDGDGVCDTEGCNEPVEPKAPSCTEHVDNDGDGVCDTEGCNESVEPETPPCTEHVDNDGDGVCDTAGCGATVEKEFNGEVTEDEWLAAIAEELYKNVTVDIYATNYTPEGVMLTRERAQQTAEGIRIDTWFKDTGEWYYNDFYYFFDEYKETSLPYMAIVMGLIEQRESFTFDDESGMYVAPESISLESAGGGIFVDTVFKNCRIKFSEEGLIDTVTCDIVMYIVDEEGFYEVTSNAVWEFYDWGTTTIGYEVDGAGFDAAMTLPDAYSIAELDVYSYPAMIMTDTSRVFERLGDVVYYQVHQQDYSVVGMYARKESDGYWIYMRGDHGEVDRIASSEEEFLLLSFATDLSAYKGQYSDFTYDEEKNAYVNDEGIILVFDAEGRIVYITQPSDGDASFVAYVFFYDVEEIGASFFPLPEAN